MPFGPFKKNNDKKKNPRQMPSHVGLAQKLRNRRNKTNEAIQFMRGYSGK